MKRLLGLLPLVLSLCLALANSDSGAWSAEQQDALNSFNRYLAAVQRADIQAIADYLHPKFVSWDQANGTPTDRDASLNGVREFLRNYSWKKFDWNPLQIQVEGQVAILHFQFIGVLSDAAGKEMSSAGPRTIILVRNGPKWAMIGLVYLEK